MNDLTPLLVLFALSNKDGFNTVKQAIEAADGFSQKIGNIKNIMSLLPSVNSIISGISSNDNQEQYIDTLKDILSKLS